MHDDDARRELLAFLISDFIEIAPSSNPRISIITPTWNTKSSWFLELAISVLQQTVLDWEWCIVDDCSSDIRFHDIFVNLGSLPNVRIVKLFERKGISGASNDGLALATAEYVCCVDHDDLLSNDALAAVLHQHAEGFDGVYSDSDKVDELGIRSEPFFKPDWSPELFRGVMYVGHLLSFRRDMGLAIGGFDSKFDGVQDFEFFLRFSELGAKIGHIPRILYHWRKAVGSVAASPDAKGDVGKLQQLAVQAHLDRLKLSARALPGEYPHRVRVAPRDRSHWPKVSIIIPTRDSPIILAQCLYSLFSRTTYPNFEVLCVDNETTDRRALEEMRSAPVERIVLTGSFNFSKANNLGRRFASGEYLVFMNNDVEVITATWLEEMLYYAEQDEVGAVGSLLLYPGNLVQHAGVVLGCRGTADHVLRNVPGNSDGYAGSLSCAHEVSAVTAACMMMPCSLFDRVDGFNEHFFTAYQDVDLCLRVRKLNKRVIFTPHSRLIHHESASRGKYYDFIDRNLLLDYWEPLIRSGDPYYNPNFDVQACNYSLSAS